jgi:hypothetical protein
MHNSRSKEVRVVLSQTLDPVRHTRRSGRVQSSGRTVDSLPQCGGASQSGWHRRHVRRYASDRDGKPDFSGIWTSDEVDPRRPNVPPNPRDATTSRRMINIGVELPGGLPYQPWLAALVKERWAKNAVDDPHVRCFPDNFLRAYGTPHLLKFAQMPGLLIVLNE